jgi:type VI protein secretion system component Hcp
MRNQRTLRGATFLSAFFILSIILSSCATATPIIPGDEYGLAAQTQVDVPGGLMLLEDGYGQEHPVLVFDFQIQSRLVVGAEYAACVEAGACEPVGETEYPLAPAGVNWYQAQAYCSYLGGRLPTEAELARAAGGEEDCQEGVITQEGFGEWVHDWDAPDYYNDSLVANPFGPMYGDLKVAMGLDLDTAGEAMGKYWIKWDELKLEEIKLDEIKLEEIKLDEIKLDEIKLDEIKLDEIKFESYKFFSMGKWEFAKDTWQYSIKFEDGKFFISAESVDMDKSGPGQGPDFPRMGMLPTSSNPLVGFRCVTEGAALTYAPICKNQTAPNCSLPAVQKETISAQVDAAVETNPDFRVAGANCPEDGAFDLTISHGLPSGEGVKIKSGGEECTCQEYEGYPGNLYCSCPSPGAGVKTEVEVCASEEETLIPMNDFCQSGSYYSLEVGGCVRGVSGTPLLYNLMDEAEPSACPNGPGLPVPNYGPLGLAIASVEGIGEGDLPDGDQWELFSLSDGSGMCPPGYAHNPETGCCSPYSPENYDCGPDQYFDAGLKQCLPIGWDGCGPCQVLGPDGVCGARSGDEMLSGRCNVGNGKEVEFDEYGRQQESSEGCDDGAYKDPGIGLCLETRDGCALGYYLDPKTETCRPLSGPESPCPDGYLYNPLTGCCVPSPGIEGSECPEGTEYDGAGCSTPVSGCPPTHYYDEETDSCLLREPGKCPSGTSLSLIGLCIPDEIGVCPEDYSYDPETDSCFKSEAGEMVCDSGKVFYRTLGFCGIPGSGTGHQGGGSGRCDIEDLSITKTVDRDSADLNLHCFDPDSALLPTRSTIESPDGIFDCLILSADKTFLSGWGICRPESSGDGDTEHFFTVEFQEGKISKIKRTSPDTIDPASATEPPMEEVTMCYSGFSIGDVIDTEDDDDEDDWSGTPTSGTLPGGAKCQVGFYIDAGRLFNLQNCATLDLTVPVCGSGPGPSPTPIPDKCAAFPFGTCQNMAGCDWSFNQNKCVEDNCTGVGDEKKCELISGCIWQADVCMVD